MKRIAIFASGSGTNAQQIITWFRKTGTAEIILVLSNKKDAFVLERAAMMDIPTLVFDKKQFYETDEIPRILLNLKCDLIVLAGFLWLVPANLLAAFQNRVINIHPALLPRYGGPGMYGSHVHKTVISAGEKESGITIHHVNEHYDEGQIIFQARCPVLPGDTPEDLAERIHGLEYNHFPRVIEQVILTL
jgi:phosphoribosylglycinamide formyltransferase 1